MLEQNKLIEEYLNKIQELEGDIEILIEDARK